MSISGVLAHRATIERASEQMVDGTPVLTWQVVAVRCSVLLSPDPTGPADPTWTGTQRHEAATQATLFALPGADLQPGDRFTMTRPPTGQTFEVLPDPATVMTLHNVSHQEHRVRQVA